MKGIRLTRSKQESKLIANQANSALHDNAKTFTNIPKTIGKAQSNERNQKNKKQTRKKIDCQPNKQRIV